MRAGQLRARGLGHTLVLARRNSRLPSRVGPGGKAPSTRDDTQQPWESSSIFSILTRRKQVRWTVGCLTWINRHVAMLCVWLFTRLKA